MAGARSLRREVSVENPVFRLFRSMPGDHVCEEFLAHVATTGEPESFPGIHPGPLDKAEPFRKLATFAIERQKRSGRDMAYCPMCHQPNKYIEGSFVYLTRLEAVAAIGHECASKENRVAAEKDYRARRDQRAEEDHLLVDLPLVARKLEVLRRVRPAAVEALRVFSPSPERCSRRGPPTSGRQGKRSATDCRRDDRRRARRDRTFWFQGNERQADSGRGFRGPRRDLGRQQRLQPRCGVGSHREGC